MHSTRLQFRISSKSKTVDRKQIKLFPKDYPIVVPSESSAGMMKHHYPELFANDPEFNVVKRFSYRILELSERELA